MKRIGVLIFTFLFLAGCGTSAEPRETIGSCMELSAAADGPRYTLSMPMPAQTREAMGLWENEDMAVFCQVLQAASLGELLRELAGRDDLVPLKSTQDGLPRYDLSWTAQTEEGHTVWRCAVVDDGTYYYCACAGIAEEAVCRLRDQVEYCFSHLQLQKALGLPA